MRSTLQLAWRRLPEHAGMAGRAGHSATLVGKRMFVLGGRNGKEYLNDLWVFDTELEVWEQLQRAPFAPRAYHTATLVANNEVWVIGGTSQKDMLGDVHVLNTDSLKWSSPETKGLIANMLRGAHAAVVHPIRKNAILVFGGYGGNSDNDRTWLKDLAILHTDSLEWEEVTPIGKAPGERGYHTFTAFGTKVALFGGKGATGDISAGILSVYDTVENKWTFPKTRGVSPSSRSSHKATLMGSNQIVVHGGRTLEKRLFDTLVLQVHTAQSARASASYKCDVSAISRRAQHSGHKSVGERIVNAAFSHDPQGRAAHSLVSKDRSLYVFGGYGGNGKYFSDAYVVQSFPELPGVGRMNRLNKTPVIVSKFQRLLERREEDQELDTEGWRSTKRRRVQVNDGHQVTEQFESTENVQPPNMDHVIRDCSRMQQGNDHAAEEGAPLPASRRIEQRLDAILGRSNPLRQGQSVWIPPDRGGLSDGHDVVTGDLKLRALEMENQKLKETAHAKDQRVVTLEAENLKLRSGIDQRVQDLEVEIERLHSRLRATETRDEALDIENRNLKANAQAQLLELHEKERRIMEAGSKMSILEQKLEQKSAEFQRSVEDLKKSNSSLVQEKEERRLQVQRLELEVESKTQTLQQSTITYEKEKAILLNEVVERKGTTDRLFTELGAAKESVRSLQETLDVLGKQLERESSKVDMLQKENEDLGRSNAALSGECKQLASSRDAAERAVQALQADLCAAQAVNRNNEVELAKLKDAVQKCNEHVTSLHASRKKDDETLQALQKENDKLRTLLREIEEFEQGQARNVQSILEKPHSL